VWWFTPVIPALQRLKYEDCKFKASLDYTRFCLNKTKQTTKYNRKNNTNKNTNTT
jgi:hypothetical protein